MSDTWAVIVTGDFAESEAIDASEEIVKLGYTVEIVRESEVS